jgi:hypothetical protein
VCYNVVMRIAPEFTKVAEGWYAHEDGSLAIIQEEDEENPGESVHSDDAEWALVCDDRHRLREDRYAGEVYDWYTTKAAAVLAAEAEFGRDV